MSASATGRLAPAPQAPAFRAGGVLWLAAGFAAFSAAMAPMLGHGPESPIAVGIATLAVLALAAEAAATTIKDSSLTHVVVPSDAVLIVGLAFATLPVLLAARLAALVIAEIFRRRAPVKLILNAAICTAEAMAAAVVYRTILAGGAPASWVGLMAAGAAVTTSTAVGLAAMSLVLRVHHSRADASVATRSLLLAGGGVAAGFAAVAVVCSAIG